MNEVWLKYPHDERYFVSESGKIQSFTKKSNGKILNTNSKNNSGYKCVTIGKTIGLHRVVYETFLGEIKDGYVINHIDGNKNNNHYLNLELVTYKENSKHAFENNLNKKGSSHGQSKLLESDIPKIFSCRKEKMTHEAIAKKFNVNRKTISSVLNGDTWTHTGDYSLNKC